MGAAAIGITIGIGVGSVETVLHITIEPNFIWNGVGTGLGIGSRAVETHHKMVETHSARRTVRFHWQCASDTLADLEGADVHTLRVSKFF